MADQFEIEIAIEEPGHASQLIDLGVHRIELCSNLNEGGLTPSAAQIEMTVDISDLPVYVMLRPRAGDFIYNRLEKHMMLEELKILSDCGLGHCLWRLRWRKKCGYGICGIGCAICA